MFRFAFDGATTVIKVVPSYNHDCTTQDLAFEIRDQCKTMGVGNGEMVWGMSVTHKQTASSKAKSPDQYHSVSFRPQDKPLEASHTVFLRSSLRPTGLMSHCLGYEKMLSGSSICSGYNIPRPGRELQSNSHAGTDAPSHTAVPTRSAPVFLVEVPNENL
jgi:hypothetical protein